VFKWTVPLACMHTQSDAMWRLLASSIAHGAALHFKQSIFVVHPCRFERWMHAALARPSAQQTKPADDVIVEGLRKYVAPFKN